MQLRSLRAITRLSIAFPNSPSIPLSLRLRASRSFSMATQTPSQSCCTVPPIVTKDYEAKGEYIDVNGWKTYRVGPSNATHAILFMFDVFGYFPQTLQGADILAYSDKERPYQVFMPDWFKGKPYLPEDFPADTEEKQKKFKAFFGGPAHPGNTKENAEAVIKHLKEKNTEIQKWAALGFCWGAKVVSLLSGPDTLLSAGGEVHPAQISADDAKNIKIPLVFLPSGDENEDQVKEFDAALTGPKHVEWFKDQVHGWMAARADLNDPRVKDEYVRGYTTVLDFFHKHL